MGVCTLGTGTTRKRRLESSLGGSSSSWSFSRVRSIFFDKSKGSRLLYFCSFCLRPLPDGGEGGGGVGEGDGVLLSVGKMSLKCRFSELH